MDLDFIQGQEYKVIKIVYYTEGNNIFREPLKNPRFMFLPWAILNGDIRSKGVQALLYGIRHIGEWKSSLADD